MGKAEELIPANVQAFANELVELASKHGLHSFNTTVQFGYAADRVWDEPINISWEEGRHGEDSHKYFISTTLRLHKNMLDKK